jgi:ribose transport system permease protein
MSSTPLARKSTVVELGERYGLIGLLLIIAVFFSVLPVSSATFFSTANLSILVSNQSVIVIVAMASLFPLIAGHFDFSVGAMTVVSSVACAGAQVRAGAPLWLAILIAVAIGTGIGFLNGVLVARFGVNSFVSTLGVATLLGGLVQLYTNGVTIIGGDPALTNFGSGQALGIPLVMFIVVVVVATVWYVLTHTPFGRSLYAIGSNPRSALLVGLPRRPFTITAFALSGGLAGIAGIVLTARTGGANPDDGTYLLFPALAAVFLGATSILPGRFNVIGTIVGVLFVAVAVSGLTLAGAQNWVSAVFNGAALLVAVFISSTLRRRREGGDS